MLTSARAKRALALTLTYAGVIVATLLAVDGVCIAFGLFPPTTNYGDPDLGWRPARATGRMAIDKCLDFSTGEVISYQRNEDGVRTALSRALIEADSTHVKIGVTGDSHTDLCAPNAQLHSSVLEADLAARGVPAIVLSYGAGRYSPLQDYLAFRKVLRPYHPTVLVLNVYTGNDFYDLLRADDRPHFISADTGYAIAEPVWYSLEDPKLPRRSRVLFALRQLGDMLGVRQVFIRVVALHHLGSQEGKGLSTVLAYMRDLWNAREPSLWYPEALAAQMLNQQLFFDHFPGSEGESLRRMRALMALVGHENPGLILVMSPLPSYELVGEQPVDAALTKALGRLPISYEEGRGQELALYEQLRGLAAEQGWIFVDNLAVLQAYRGPERLYNEFDYHLLPTASGLVGHAQAEALVDSLRGPARRVD